MFAQAAQRGVTGTKQILEEIMQGTDIALGSKIFVVDLLPNRSPCLNFALFPAAVPALFLQFSALVTKFQRVGKGSMVSSAGAPQILGT